MAEKTVIVKNDGLTSASIISIPHVINTGKLYLVSYTILNKVQKDGSEIREMYLFVPNKNESYLIISTSFKHSSDFANRFQNVLDSLTSIK